MEGTSGVAGVLLAAAGSRLGQPKALVEIGGEPLARRGVALLRDGGAAPIVVVTGAVAVDLPGVLAVHNQLAPYLHQAGWHRLRLLRLIGQRIRRRLAGHGLSGG